MPAPEDETFVEVEIETDHLSHLGRVGYDAYGDEAEWKAYNGAPMPTWDELPDHIRRKWRVAARAIANSMPPLAKAG